MVRRLGLRLPGDHVVARPVAARRRRAARLHREVRVGEWKVVLMQHTFPSTHRTTFPHLHETTDQLKWGYVPHPFLP